MVMHSPKFQEPQNPSPRTLTLTGSPTSAAANGHHPLPPITRSEPNSPYPTTFVQADSSNFKQVVQMLTGSAETSRVAARPDLTRSSIPLIKTGPRKDKSGSRLYERRNSFKSFQISPLGPGLVNTRPGFVTGSPEILSPSILDFPSLVLSPVTPLIPDPFKRGPTRHNGTMMNITSNLNSNVAEEEKAIQEKGYYLHPSPRTESEPRLLTLFPLTSPRAADESSSSRAAAESSSSRAAANS